MYIYLSDPCAFHALGPGPKATPTPQMQLSSEARASVRTPEENLIVDVCVFVRTTYVDLRPRAPPEGNKVSGIKDLGSRIWDLGPRI